MFHTKNMGLKGGYAGGLVMAAWGVRSWLSLRSCMVAPSWLPSWRRLSVWLKWAAALTWLPSLLPFHVILMGDLDGSPDSGSHFAEKDRDSAQVHFLSQTLQNRHDQQTVPTDQVSGKLRFCAVSLDYFNARTSLAFLARTSTTSMQTTRTCATYTSYIFVSLKRPKSTGKWLFRQNPREMCV